MESSQNQNYGYGKRPLWQWILIYVVIGGILYGLIYYFVFANKGGYSYTNNNSKQTTPAGSTTIAKNSVQISSFSYSPETLVIKPGDTVTWTNQDSVGHSATADDKSFDTGILDKGKSATVTFGKAGTYTYYCTPHPNMHGTIIVK